MGTQPGEKSTGERKVVQEGNRGIWGPWWRIKLGMRSRPGLSRDTNSPVLSCGQSWKEKRTSLRLGYIQGCRLGGQRSQRTEQQSKEEDLSNRLGKRAQLGRRAEGQLWVR